MCLPGSWLPSCPPTHNFKAIDFLSTPSLTSGKKMFTMIEHFLTNSYYNNSMFGKAKCKLCGDDVRFALRHLKQKHPEVLADKDVAKLNMSRVIEKYFD
jgi:hypothetical protein